VNTVVAITGASAGIGRATALRFARDGATVAICARRKDRLDAVAREIVAAGGQPVAVVADVTKPEDMQAFVDHIVGRFGRLDVMMCNAGYGIYGESETIRPEQMRELMDVNYHGTFNAIRAALPVFKKQQSGHLFVISSIVGKRGIPFMGAYSATKFAQVGLAECVRAELINTPIRVSIVYPISTETEFFQVMTEQSGFATRASGPRQTPDKVADAIVAAVGKERPEIYPLKKARGLALIAAVAPGWCDRLVKRWGRKPVRP
jgi:NADP-dependent 3-hydroxy acid dehydrogenase YdfG